MPPLSILYLPSPEGALATHALLAGASVPKLGQSSGYGEDCRHLHLNPRLCRHVPG